MKITLFDVALETVKEKDLETIRFWRNSDKIRMRMEYRDTITPEQHLNWYKEFSDYKTAFAYMIVYKGEQIGVISSKNMPDYSEGGMFIWVDRYLGSIVPVVVSLLKTDMNFYFMKNEFSYIKILNDNYGAISFNTKLGYKLCEGQEGKYNRQYVLTKDAYEKNVGKFKKMLETYYREPYQVTLLGSQEDVDNGLIDYYLKIFHQNDGGIKLFYPMFSVATGLLFDRNDKLLIYLRDDKEGIPFPDHWDLFGGIIEKGESPEQALVREVEEELGITLKNYKKFREYDCRTGDVKPNWKYVYYAKINAVPEELKLDVGQRMTSIFLENRHEYRFANILGTIIDDFANSPFKFDEH